MKFINVVAFLAVAIGVTSAALPVEPMNAFVLQDQNQQQHIIEERKPVLPNTFKSYIVVFKDTAAAQVIEKAEKEILSFGGKIGQRYSAALKGFSALIPGPIVTALSTNPFIDYIEEDGEVLAYQ
ncbi:hypothetical protein BG011_008949 [Mortierella polycephala]|uniref:Inhibitor I9 domain-containing protein n=1 Tax=Mortierella polycephala TaxID=41804 RepID=A0A9P6U7X2_9FUNG|nr:hypothetical protein BG011_008949 [Mortierella polycephala]